MYCTTIIHSNHLQAKVLRMGYVTEGGGGGGRREEGGRREGGAGSSLFEAS